MIDFHKVLHKGMYHKKKGHKIRASFCYWFLRVFYQCDINLQAKVDGDVWFCHSGFGIVVNPSAEIRGGGYDYSA